MDTETSMGDRVTLAHLPPPSGPRLALPPPGWPTVMPVAPLALPDGTHESPDVGVLRHAGPASSRPEETMPSAYWQTQQGQHPGVVGASPWEISDPAAPPALAAWVESRKGPLRRFGARPRVVLLLSAAAIGAVAAVAAV